MSQNDTDKLLISFDDKLMLEMFNAYENGISPAEFRKSRIDDINFIMDFKTARNQMMKQKEHEMKVKQVMENLKNGRSW